MKKFKDIINQMIDNQSFYYEGYQSSLAEGQNFYDDLEEVKKERNMSTIEGKITRLYDTYNSFDIELWYI